MWEIWSEILKSIPGNIAYDILKSGGSMTRDRLKLWQENKAQQPMIQHQLGRSMRQGASLPQLNHVSQALLQYYARAQPAPTPDVHFAHYSRKGQHLVDLPIISRRAWINAVTEKLPIISTYIDPEDHPLPIIPKTNHRPGREVLRIENLFNGYPYILRQISVENSQIKTDFSDGRFFSWRDTYGDLEDEFIMNLPAIFHDPNIGLTSPSHRFQLRSQLLPNTETILNFGNRVNAGGVVILSVFIMEDHDARVMVEARSGIVSDGNGLLTTIPRGFHDSMVKRNDDDYELQTTVMREVVEEIFRGGNRRDGEPETRAYLEACPAVNELLEQGSFRLLPTGIIIDLIKGNYTFTYLLLTTDSTWWPRYRKMAKLNEEFPQNDQMTSFKLSQTNSIERLTMRPDWTTEGYFAFIEGLRALYPIMLARNMNEILIGHAERAIDTLPDLEWRQLKL